MQCFQNKLLAVTPPIVRKMLLTLPLSGKSTSSDPLSTSKSVKNTVVDKFYILYDSNNCSLG